MTPPPPPQQQGGRALLRGTLGPIPVHLDVSFVVFVGLLGFLSAPDSPRFIIQFVVIGAIAVLLHELGHAVSVLAFGGRPAVALAGLGGLTSWHPPRDMRRWELILISGAGPGVGLALFPLIVLLDRAVAPAPGGALDEAFWIAKFTTLGWSLLNLLPLLPMDGGQILRELIPGTPLVRLRRALSVSIGVGVVLGVIAWRLEFTFAPVLLAFLTVSNVLQLRSLPSAEGAPAPQALPAAGHRAVPDIDGHPLPAEAPAQDRILTALWQGRRDDARQALVASDPPVEDRAVHGAVLAVSPDPTEAIQGVALLEQELAERPDDESVLGWFTLALTLRHDWARLGGLLDASRAGRPLPIGGNVAVRALQEAWRSGDPDAVGRLAGAALYRAPSRPGAPALAYLAAVASIARAASSGGDASPTPEVKAAATAAWAALDGVPGAREFTLAALAPGQDGRDPQVARVTRPLERIPAYLAARDALAATVSA